MCTEPQHFIDMSELLKEQVTQLLEALKVVIQLHGVVHTQASYRATDATVVIKKLKLVSEEKKIESNEAKAAHEKI